MVSWLTNIFFFCRQVCIHLRIYLVSQCPKHQWCSAVVIVHVHSIPVDKVSQHSRLAAQCCCVMQWVRIVVITTGNKRQRVISMYHSKIKKSKWIVILIAYCWLITEFYLSRVLIVGTVSTGAVSGAPSSSEGVSFSGSSRISCRCFCVCVCVCVLWWGWS